MAIAAAPVGAGTQRAWGEPFPADGVLTLSDPLFCCHHVAVIRLLMPPGAGRKSGVHSSIIRESVRASTFRMPSIRPCVWTMERR